MSIYISAQNDSITIKKSFAKWLKRQPFPNMNDNLFPIVGYGMIGGFDHIHTQRGADCDDWSEKTPHGKLLLEDFLHLMVFHNRNECFFYFTHD